MPQAYTTPKVSYEPTHIKQIRTTAPMDMKVAKEQRLKGKAEAKERRMAPGSLHKKARKKHSLKFKAVSRPEPIGSL